MDGGGGRYNSIIFITMKREWNFIKGEPCTYLWFMRSMYLSRSAAATWGMKVCELITVHLKYSGVCFQNYASTSCLRDSKIESSPAWDTFSLTELNNDIIIRQFVCGNRPKLVTIQLLPTGLYVYENIYTILPYHLHFKFIL